MLGLKTLWHIALKEFRCEEEINDDEFYLSLPFLSYRF